MAHSCPDCGLTCYCGGDIDDILLDETDEQRGCIHYHNRECDGYETDIPEDFDQEWEESR